MDRRHAYKLPPRAKSIGDDLVARLERALIVAAYIVANHGDVFIGYVDRLEKELDEARKADPVARANAILDRHLSAAHGNPDLPPAAPQG